jgi:hypothetical protein
MELRSDLNKHFSELSECIDRLASAIEKLAKR